MWSFAQEGAGVKNFGVEGEGGRSFAPLEMVGLGKCSPEAEGVKGRLAPEEAGVMVPEEEKGEGGRK